MNDLFPLLLEHGSYLVFLVALLAAGMGLPVPEDVVLLTAGVLLHRGVVALPPTALTLAAGVVGGDLMIFMAGRRMGPAVLRWGPVARVMTPHRQARLEGWFTRWGSVSVVVARHMSGLRAPTFALAGSHGMKVWLFLLWDLLGFCLSGPLFVGIGYLFSGHLDDAWNHVVRVQHILLFAVVGVLLLGSGYLTWRHGFGRRPPRPAPPSQEDARR